MNKMNKMKKLNLAATAVAIIFALTSIGVWSLPKATAQAQEVKAKAGKTDAALVPAGTYNLDPMHSIVGFAVRHFEINWVEGRFKDLTGTINYNERDATKSTVTFTAKIESVDTGVAPRDAHLKTPDFFDAAKYPRGCCLTVGGDESAFKQAEPIFKSLAPGKGEIEESKGRENLDSTAAEGYLYCGNQQRRTSEI